MFTRLRVAIVAAILALSIGAPAAVQAHTYGTIDHYASNCQGGSNSATTQGGVSRPVYPATANFPMVQSTVEIGALHACNYPYGSNDGVALVNAANVTGTYTWVQFGYAQWNCPSGHCNDFTNGITDFWWTPLDHAGTYEGHSYTPGQIYAATWVDFNNDGTHDFPAGGEVYRFNINRASVGGNPKWQLCIFSVSGRFGSTGYDCTYIDAGQFWGTTIWWSFEIGNDASGFGPDQIETAVTMDNMEYQFYGNNATYHVTGSAGSCDWFGTSHTSDQHCGIGDRGTGYNFLNAYQLLHH
jgi:hypothetical protein